MTSPSPRDPELSTLSAPVPADVPAEAVEAACRATEPELFSDDERTAHRAASPMRVEYAREAVRSKMRAIIAAALPHLTREIAAGEGVELRTTEEERKYFQGEFAQRPGYSIGCVKPMFASRAAQDIDTLRAREADAQALAAAQGEIERLTKEGNILEEALAEREEAWRGRGDRIATLERENADLKARADRAEADGAARKKIVVEMLAYPLRKLNDCAIQLRATGQADVAHILDQIASVLRALANTPAKALAERAKPDAGVAVTDALLEAVEANCWDVRCIAEPTGGGDADVAWEVIEHHMAAPRKRSVGYGKTPAAAIRAALAPTDAGSAQQHGEG